MSKTASTNGGTLLKAERLLVLDVFAAFVLRKMFQRRMEQEGIYSVQVVGPRCRTGGACASVGPLAPILVQGGETEERAAATAANERRSKSAAAPPSTQKSSPSLSSPGAAIVVIAATAVTVVADVRKYYEIASNTE
jgi:hypothetical protein